jgi:peptide/nickel transport system substrate-binding protein
VNRRDLLRAAAAMAAPSCLAAPAVAQRAKTQTLRFIPQSSLSTLDPMFSSEVIVNHGYYVFDTLYSADGKGVAQPQMAAGHTVSDDGRTWRIRLRDGLTFHDGTPVRSIDCATSLQRWCKLEAFGQLLDAAIDRWVTSDDRVIEVRLKRPFPLLADALGKVNARVPFIMPERLARTDPYKAVTEMIGSGPYRFRPDEYDAGSRVVYERFDGYDPRSEPPDWASGGKIAYYPRIEWHVVPDAATAAAALRADEVDWWEVPLPDLYSELGKSAGIKLQVDNPYGRSAFMRLNHMQPPFDDLRLRRAVLAGVRQADYMQAIFGDAPGLWRECHSQFPCSTPYAVEDAGGAMPGDPAIARKMLLDAGYRGQKTVLLNPTDNPLIAPLGLVTADLLKTIGMNVELATSDWGTVVQRRASKEPVDKGGWSIMQSYGPVSAYASPATNPLLRGNGYAGYFGWWTSSEAESLLQAWVAAPDLPQRNAAGTALDRLAMDQVAIVPLGQFFGRTAYRRTVTGVLPGGAPYPWNVRPA